MVKAKQIVPRQAWALSIIRLGVAEPGPSMETYRTADEMLDRLGEVLQELREEVLNREMHPFSLDIHVSHWPVVAGGRNEDREEGTDDDV